MQTKYVFLFHKLKATQAEEEEEMEPANKKKALTLTLQVNKRFLPVGLNELNDYVKLFV